MAARRDSVEKEGSRLIGNILDEEDVDEGDEQAQHHHVLGSQLLRSSSAPPQLAIRAETPRDLEPGTVVVNGETVSTEDVRLTREYYAYYYGQKPLDPRLPPPLFNWDSWAYPTVRGLNNTNAEKAAEALAKAARKRSGAEVGFEKAPIVRASSPVGAITANGGLDLAATVQNGVLSDSHPPLESPTARVTAPILQELPSPTNNQARPNPQPIAPRPQQVIQRQVYMSPQIGRQQPPQPQVIQPPHQMQLPQPQQLQSQQLAQQQLVAAAAAAAAQQQQAPPQQQAGAPFQHILQMPLQYPVGADGRQALQYQPLQPEQALYTTSLDPNTLQFANLNQHPAYELQVSMAGLSLAPQASSNFAQPNGPPAYSQNPFPQYGNGQVAYIQHDPRQVGQNPFGNAGVSAAQLQAGQPYLQQLGNGMPQQAYAAGPFRTATFAPPGLPANPNLINGRPAKPNQANGAGRRASNRQNPQPNQGNLSPNSARRLAAAGAVVGAGAGAPNAAALPGPFPNQFPAQAARQPANPIERAGVAAVPPAAGPGLAAASWLEDFRLHKASHMTLADVVKRGMIVELATDQYGSRFIQQKLETANAEEKEMAFRQLLPETLRLCTDVFGNYVIQKFFDYGVFEHKRVLGLKMVGNVLALSLQMFGCRVVQKAIDVSDVDTQTYLISELRGHVMQCVKDQNGNHVIQKCIEKVPNQHIQFIVDAFQGQVFHLSTHPYGCRVIQRLLEHCSELQRNAILVEVLNNIDDLCKNQYGNYVIQHVLIHGSLWHRQAIVQALRGKILPMAKHKYASNVVEKCFAHCTRDERQSMIEEVIGRDSDSSNRSTLVAMVKDQYANYVVQKLLDVVDDEQRALLVARIRRHVPALRKIPYGKHIISRVEKMTGKPIVPA